MLDPAKMLEAMQASMTLGQTSQSSLSQPFIAGMSSMQMSGPGAAAQIMADISKTCSDMCSNMDGVFSSLQASTTAHQTAQENAKPEDFEAPMDDLRSTLSKGFPNEMANFFSKIPKM